MPFIIDSNRRTNNRTFPIASEGPHAATLIHVKDLGLQETRFGPKHRVRFDWRIDDQCGPDGSEIRCFQSFNLSFDAKSHLRKAVAQILGNDPGDRFDLETLVNTRATLVIGHDEGSDGQVYANVRAALPLRSAATGGEPKAETNQAVRP